MTGLLSILAILTAVAFIGVPVVLTVSIANRYRKVEHAIAHYTALVRALIAYIERGESPVVEPPPSAPMAHNESMPSTVERLIQFVRPRPQAPFGVTRYRVKDEFEDYLAVIRQGESEAARFIRFKRKNLHMQQTLIEDLEYCRTYTEVLPYMGILGTVLGFFFSPAVFAPGAASASSVGGLVLALASTAAALACILVIKLFFENAIIPQYIEFTDALAAVDDYMARYGELTGEDVKDVKEHVKENTDEHVGTRLKAAT